MNPIFTGGAQQKRSLISLVRTLYIFATVIVCFAILGFLFILYYYNALGSMHTSNHNSARTVGARVALLSFQDWANYIPASTVIKQEGGRSGALEGTQRAIWHFDTTQINISRTDGGDLYELVTKNNVIGVADKSNGDESWRYYSAVLNEDLRVTCSVEIGENMYIFYERSWPNNGQVQKTFGVGKLNMEGLTYDVINDDILLPGPPLMALVQDTYIFLYFLRGTDVVVSRISLPFFEKSIFESNINNLLYNGGTSKPLFFQHFWTSVGANGDFEATFFDASPILPAENANNYNDNIHDIEWNEYLSKYVLLSTSNKHTKLDIWFSSSLYGPFISHTLIVEPTTSKREHTSISHGYFHKELWRDHGRIMVFTYCNGGSLPHRAEIQTCKDNLSNNYLCT